MFKFTKKEAYMIASTIKDTIENEIKHYNVEGSKKFDIVAEKRGFGTIVDISRKESNGKYTTYDNMINYDTMFMMLGFNLISGFFNNSAKKVEDVNFSVYDEKFGEYVTILVDIKRKGLHDLIYNFFELLGYIEVEDEEKMTNSI